MLAKSKIEQLESEIQTKNEAFEMKEAAWKAKVRYQSLGSKLISIILGV